VTTINVPGLPSSRRTPGVYLAVILGGVATSAAAATKSILLLGNRISSALVGSAPVFSVPAGTRGNASPVALYSADDALTLFGQGSELHRMALRVFSQYPDATVTACAVAESGGARATGVLAIAGSPTAALEAFTLRFRLSDKVIDVPVSTGDTGAVIAAACADAILQEANLPYTAQYAAVYSDGNLTLTAKHPGPRGNRLVVYASVVSSAGVETPVYLVTAGGTTYAGLNFGWSGVAATESTYRLTGGTTADDFTAALAAVATQKFDRYALACQDATNVDLVAAQLDSMAGVTTQKRQQYVAALDISLATAITFAVDRNDRRGQIVWHYNSPVPPEEVAAEMAAARLIGDATAGGSLVGEATDPACNLDGLELRDILQQTNVGEQPTATEIESALGNGLTPLAPSTLNPGKTTVVRSVTTCCRDANAQPNYANLDTTTVTVPDYVADDLQSDLATVYRGKKISADSSDGSPPLSASVVTPNTIRDRIARKLKTYEESAILTDVDANMSLLQVVLNGTVAGRVDCEIPCEPIPGLHITAGNVRQV